MNLFLGSRSAVCVRGGRGCDDVQLIHYITTIISNMNSISLITYRSYVNYITLAYLPLVDRF